MNIKLTEINNNYVLVDLLNRESEERVIIIKK